jgi:hypothetical protein
MNDKKAWSWAGQGGEDDLQLRRTQVAPHHQMFQPPAKKRVKNRFNL